MVVDGGINYSLLLHFECLHTNNTIIINACSGYKVNEGGYDKHIHMQDMEMKLLRVIA